MEHFESAMWRTAFGFSEVIFKKSSKTLRMLMFVMTLPERRTKGCSYFWLFGQRIVLPFDTILSRSKQRKISPTDSNSEEVKYSSLHILLTKNYYRAIKRVLLQTFIVGLNKFLDDISVLVRNEQNFLKFASKNEMVENICECRTICNRKKTFRTIKSNRI